MPCDEALGAVGHAVEQDPAAEPAADEADERDLEEGVLHERLAPGLARATPRRQSCAVAVVVVVGGQDPAALRRRRTATIAPP